MFIIVTDGNIKMLRHESSGNHVITLKWRRILWLLVKETKRDYSENFDISGNKNDENFDKNSEGGM